MTSPSAAALTEQDLIRLRQIAEAAMPLFDWWQAEYLQGATFDERHLTHIATFDPATVLRLIVAARLADSRPVVSEAARTDLTAELADMTMDIRIDPDTVARIALGPTIAANIVEVVMRSHRLSPTGDDSP